MQSILATFPASRRDCFHQLTRLACAASAIAALFLTALPIAAQADGKTFRAGAATSNITPPLGEMIVGGWEPMPAQHIHDELYARCLVLDDGTTKLAIVICDNVGIPHEVFDAAKTAIHEATEIPIANLMMASTHTHSATTARGESKVIEQSELTEYQKFLASRIADGVRCALNHLQPAKIGWGSVDEPSEVFNRRWFVTDPQLATNPFGGIDQVRMNPPRGHAALDRQAGPVDPEVSFVSVQSLDGSAIALLANYSLHYVGGVPRNEVSADYFGYFARAIEKRLGATETTPAFVGMLSNGTSGDVNNIDFRDKTPKRYASYEKMQEVANKIADRVYDAHGGIDFHDWVKLSAASTPLTLKVRKPTQEMRDYFDALAKNSEQSPRHRREAIYANRIAKLDEAPDTVDIQLQTFGIGDLGIAAIPFETFTETGLELKAKAPTKQMFTIELANGSFGYLPTPRQHRFGGYETWLGTNYVQEDATEKIVETLLGLFDTMK
ncbi:neutral/alkaline non-lysosomal ceramidase N-terminal domain-containing protein [Stieleria magnilauensis]|uniref:Neutral/alkaline non-lysosomal ceramidase n=1 Tax=Stieleria magnilauensis TaxID=2527963 RepID=A0ABX5XMV2_9BACT|nr:Neutral/alkaline non-lysosomal ceramidase [Planctomycetes bacterium TBK1r]